MVQNQLKYTQLHFQKFPKCFISRLHQGTLLIFQSFFKKTSSPPFYPHYKLARQVWLRVCDWPLVTQQASTVKWGFKHWFPNPSLTLWPVQHTGSQVPPPPPPCSRWQMLQMSPKTYLTVELTIFKCVHQIGVEHLICLVHTRARKACWSNLH